MSSRFVLDTVGFINYFNEFFNEANRLSPKSREILNSCFDNLNYNKLIIPSVVFIEIYTKFLKTEEQLLKFYYTIFIILKDNQDVEIKPLEREVISIYNRIDRMNILEFHDKIIYASAVQLECPLISNDSKIIDVERIENNLIKIMF